MKIVINLFTLILILTCNACGDSRDHLVLLDSVPINDSCNAYWFTQRGGIPAESSGGFLSIARSSKEISTETACLKTPIPYYSMGMVDSVLLVHLYTDDDWEWLEGDKHDVQIEVTKDASNLPIRPALNIRPYDD